MAGTACPGSSTTDQGGGGRSSGRPLAATSGRITGRLCAAAPPLPTDTPIPDDLDDEQPIYVRMTLADYRRAARLKHELERTPEVK